jgi:hypothetical protein
VPGIGEPADDRRHRVGREVVEVEGGEITAEHRERSEQVAHRPIVP